MLLAIVRSDGSMAMKVAAFSTAFWSWPTVCVCVCVHARACVCVHARAYIDLTPFFATMYMLHVGAAVNKHDVQCREVYPWVKASFEARAGSGERNAGLVTNEQLWLQTAKNGRCSKVQQLLQYWYMYVYTTSAILTLVVREL